MLGKIDKSESARSSREGKSSKALPEGINYKISHEAQKIANMIGVSKDTVRLDIGENSPPIENSTIDNQDVMNDSGENSPPTGAELVQKEQRK